MLNGIPRGEAFVNFMRSSSSEVTTSSTQSPAPVPVKVVPTPGNFDPNAQSTTLSRVETPQPDGSMQIDAEKSFNDGSRRVETLMKYPDGSSKLVTERRSMPDENGNQKVRVWEVITEADGTQSATFSVFRVPEGLQMDWDSAAAQNFLLESSVRDPATEKVPQPTPGPANTGASSPSVEATLPDTGSAISDALSADERRSIEKPTTAPVVP